MNRLISLLASRFRGERFDIDPAIPSGYLLAFATAKLLARLRGILRFGAFPTVFIGKGARLKCTDKIRISGFANFNADCYVDALSRNGVVVGRGFSLGRGASIECTGSLKTLGAGFTAGDNVGIGSSSFLGCAGGISIGSDTILGNLVSMHSENHNFEDADLPIRLQGVSHRGIRVGRNCWIGAKATILDGANIGDHSIVAAGAVVLAGDYEAGSLLAGVPARKIKNLR
ncbi:hypothetical protein GCM10009116_03790 [Brevundimonas basaltis]|uniref:Acetyltransferase-like isoleucine patch superfamily enzyme n=1 Tax=Brevundimonas basaltis TaxID=472166 RepID=A0A7W8MHH1_9CAUL|nr:acyltransferase [Brevundimonas basaltis]MBB5292649.1 acetyltransferase-like isoleucine patch superfamily enzyme [Brevundimonas basaltis]